MIKGIHHIAIAVKDLERMVSFYEELFNIKASKTEVIPQQGVKAALISLPNGSEIEIIQPLDDQGGVAKFIESRGEGLHHICLEVDDVDQELENLARRGVQLIDRQGRPGLAGKVGFIHPKASGGVLIELVQLEESSEDRM